MTAQSLTARDVAVSVLREGGGSVADRLDALTETHRLSSVDVALAREIAFGVVRRRSTLWAVLRAFLKEPNRRLPGPVPYIMLVAAYQLLFLDRVPDFAAVDEAVGQMHRHGQKHQSGMVNAVLRNVARNVSEVQSGKPPLAKDAIPTAADAYRWIKRPVFPEPHDEPARYLAAAFSLPVHLAGRWLEQFGSLEATADVCLHAVSRPPMILRANTLKTSVEDLLKRLADEGLEVQPHENALSVVLATHVDVRSLSAFDEGLFQPQDPTATAVGLTAEPEPGMNVLDFCAAPGTKTTHLAELMGGQGHITAVDVSEQKLARVRDNCGRMSIEIVETHLANEIGTLATNSFDLALVDVPCSNTGVLARRPEARWRINDENIARLARDQCDLLSAAAAFVKPGGRVVYSTCSLEPEENDQVVREFLRRVPSAELLRQRVTTPSGADDSTRWHDGGFVAVLRV
ncbi:MAG: transcription antitermination factor NusB [Planctomycetota bacterium]